jgi:hypothetical protein
MVADARLAAGDLPNATLADLPTLKALAAQGRYLKQYEATKPKV